MMNLRNILFSFFLLEGIFISHSIAEEKKTLWGFGGNLSLNPLKILDILGAQTTFIHPFFEIHWGYKVGYTQARWGKIPGNSSLTTLYFGGMGPSYFFSQAHRISVFAHYFLISDPDITSQKNSAWGWNVHWSSLFPLTPSLSWGPEVEYYQALAKKGKMYYSWYTLGVGLSFMFE